MIDRKISPEELFRKRDDRVPVVTVEERTGRILGLNITNQAAFERTISTGLCHYFDEVNQVVYLKGEHSREIETIKSITLDCCHARRHILHLLYTVDMAEGACKFGMADCHFYRYEDGNFVFRSGDIRDMEAVRTFRERIETLLTVAEDREHQKRFVKMEKK